MVTDHSVGPQSTSQPCIICGTTQAHNPAFFGYNNFQQSGNISSYNAYSTTPTAELPDGTPGISNTRVYGAVGGVRRAPWEMPRNNS